MPDAILLLIVIGSVITTFFSTYVVSSRCSKIDCGCLHIERDVLPADKMTIPKQSEASRSTDNPPIAKPATEIQL